MCAVQMLSNMLTKEDATVSGVNVGTALALAHGLARLLADMLHVLERQAKRIVGASAPPQVRCACAHATAAPLRL